MKEALRGALRQIGRAGKAGGRRVSSLVRRLLDRDRAADAAARAAAAVAAPWRPRGRIDPAAHARLREHAGRATTGSFDHPAGSRPWRLYVAAGAARRGGGPPLLVMLHGCKQDADDFAAGTRMDERAEAEGWLVLYPGQPKQAHRACCWNWYRRGHQRRDAGEPALIAALTRQVMADYGVDPRRVHVAGLSAGGAMAATLAALYPDLYASCGVHSGVPHGAARNVVEALHVMRRGGEAPPPAAVAAFGAVHAVVGRVIDGRLGEGGAEACAGRAAGDGGAPRTVPTIVFHGDRDSVVHPSNAGRMMAGLLPGDADVEARFGPGGDGDGGRRTYTRTLHRDADGGVVGEHWLVHGAGHAWSGGSPAGSYTDPLGPDASAEMLRFFAAHPHPRPVLPSHDATA